MSHDNAFRRSYERPGNDLAAAREPPPSMRQGISASSCALRDKQQWSGVEAAGPRRRAGTGVWAVPGSNGRPPACKARAAAAIYCGLSLIPLGEPRTAHICCALLRFVASTALPQAVNPLTPERAGLAPCSPAAGEPAYPLRLGDRIARQHEHSRGAGIETAHTGAGDRNPVGARELLQLRLQRRQVLLSGCTDD